MSGTVLLMQNVLLGQTKVMQIRQGETLNHQGAITHEVCLAAQLFNCEKTEFLTAKQWLSYHLVTQKLSRTILKKKGKH